MGRLPLGASLEERFFNKVSRQDCWLWIGAVNSRGYGLFGIGGGKSMLAHRWSYEHHVGPIPVDLQLDHLCRVRNCVNPDHLEPVTGRENSRRAAERRTQGLCLRGHPLLRNARGKAHCPECHKLYKARNRDKQFEEERQRRLRPVRPTIVVDDDEPAWASARRPWWAGDEWDPDEHEDEWVADDWVLEDVIA